MKRFDVKQFLAESPETLDSIELQALWWDGHDDWQKAHDLVDGPTSKSAARIHAYLHRKEGDLWNADYWYRRAGDIRPDFSLDQEWEFLCEKYWTA